MKITLLAIGRLARSPEVELVKLYVDRATAAGRALGLGPVEVVEVEAKKPGKAAEAEVLRPHLEDAHVIACDVTDEAQVKAMVAKALSVFGGRVDILVNVAGVTGPIETPVQDIKVEDFDYVIIANERGTFLPIKHVAPTMIAQRAGKIVNISGTSGLGIHSGREVIHVRFRITR